MKENANALVCSTCSVFYDAHGHSIDFKRDGVHFFVSIPDYSFVAENYLSECPKHFPGSLAKLFELYKKRGVIEYGGNGFGNISVFINWKEYVRYFKINPDNKYLNVLLMAIGKLSLSPRQAWEIVADGGSRFGKTRKHNESLNPGEGRFYFSDRHDAAAYAKLRWPRSKGYKWEIRKIEDVYTANMCYRR